MHTLKSHYPTKSNTTVNPMEHLPF